MDDWQSRLANSLTQGDTAALPEVLILLGALIGCSSFALIQFFTMLGTRWGDKNPAPKSFVLSILVHVVVMLAWSTVIAIRPLPAVMSLPSNIAASIPIRQLDEHELDDNFTDDNIPFWQKLDESPEQLASRQERPLDEPEEMAEAPRLPTELPTVSIDPAELANISDQPMETELPNPEMTAEQTPIKPEAAPIAPPQEAPTTEARADAGAGSPSRRQSRATNLEEDSDELPKTRGSDSAIAVPRPDDQGLSIPLDPAGEGDENPVLSGMKSDTVRKGVPAPMPARGTDGDFVPDGRADQTGKPSFTRAKGLGRDRTRQSSDGLGDDNPAPRISSNNRSIPNPDPERMLGPLKSAVDGQPGDTPTPAKGAGPNLPNRSPATYKYRQLEKRRGTALKNGGSLESEKAVENSLKWLAKVQEPDGFWDADKHGGGANPTDPLGHLRKKGGQRTDTGVTGLALLAFMGAGYTPTDGEYSDNVDRAIQWLILQQDGNGYLGGSAVDYDKMYCHAIATFALGEACGMMSEAERPPELRRAVRLAVDYIIDRQGTDGGWRYDKYQRGDVSMFGWQLMALKSADIAGIKASPEVWAGMVKFLKSHSQGDQDGLAGYNTLIRTGQSTPQLSPPTPAMTAEALFCKQMIGINRRNKAAQEAVGYLLKNLPHLSRYDEYYWYYGTLAMFQHGGESWSQWNATQRDLLVELQETRGKNAGSWDPKGKWAGIGGRIYSTALSTLCLEVYYRYLPLYQTNQE